MSYYNTDILFVVPSYNMSAESESIGTLILAKAVKMAGYTTRIVRYWEAYEQGLKYEEFSERILKIILANNPHIVSFYCRGIEYHICLDLASRIKNNKSDTLIVFGGPQADLVAKETLLYFKQVDYVCCGEGENTIVPLLDQLIKTKTSQQNLTSIPGLVYRCGESVKKNMNPIFLADNYARAYNYYDLIPCNITREAKRISIDVGRGCPYSCYFCSTKTFWKQRFRLRDISNVVDEIEYVIKKYGIRNFSFEHDLFTFNRQRVMAFCDILKSRNIKIKWSCSSRINTIDCDIIDCMAESGLDAIYFGIESGSARMQKLIKKNISIDKSIEIVSYVQKKGISITLSFIYGFPEEVEDDVEKTLKLVHIFREIGVQNIQMHRLTFDKGTEIYEKYKEKLISPSDNKYLNNSLGVTALKEQYINRYPEIFSIFYDYASPIRDEMKYLPIFNMLGAMFPKTMTSILEILCERGMKNLLAYRIFLSECSSMLEAIAKNTSILTQPMLSLMMEKMIRFFLKKREYLFQDEVKFIQALRIECPWVLFK